MKVKLALLLLLLLSVALAQEVVNPKLAKTAELIIEDKGTITVLNGIAHYLDMNLTIPQETESQKVSYTGLTLFLEVDGNVIGNVQVNNPENPFSYSVQSVISSTEYILTSLPEEYDIPPEVQRFVNPSERAQSDDSRIKQLALELTANSSSDYERIAKLAIWTHEFIEYTFDLVGTKKDALWILDNRKGVCVEYTNLFTALARSLGYPTRMVLGHSYGSYGWLGHAWAEVYLGKWVPVDPTWLEVGNLDATHIPFFYSDEPTASSNVYVRVTKGAELKWDKQEFNGLRNNNTNVQLKELTYNEEVTDYAVSTDFEGLGFGDEAIVYLALESEEYRVVDVNLVSCASNKEVIKIVDSETQYLIMEPGTKRVASWRIKVSEDLDPNVIYTCPLTMNSQYLEESVINIQVKKAASVPIFNPFLSKHTLQLGSIQTVFVQVPTLRKDLSVFVATDDQIFRRDVTDSSIMEFNFTASKVGSHKVRVFTSQGGAVELQFNVIKESDIFIDTLQIKSEVMQNGDVTARAIIRNNKATENIDVIFEFGDIVQSKKVSVSGSEVVEFIHSPSEVGEFLATIIISSEGIYDQISQPVSVLSRPEVTLMDYEIETIGEAAKVTFTLRKDTSAKNVTLTIGSRTEKAEGSIVVFTVKPGEYTTTLTWYDGLGNRYVSRDSLELRQSFAVQVGSIVEDPTLVLLFAFAGLGFMVFLIILVNKLRRPRPPKPKFDFKKNLESYDLQKQAELKRKQQIAERRIQEKREDGL